MTGSDLTRSAELRLIDALAPHDAIVIAVSGGVDSMTLAWLAHRRARGRIAMVHAVSPAVPASATARVREYAAREKWALTVTGAGEFDDPDYVSNPVDRCYFCKANLYARIRALSSGVIASGTNVDDLGDYRPGLRAASERGVLHPYVEAGIDKRMVRALAHAHRLDDLAELPAQPCLASRVETGIGIDTTDLAFIEHVESTLAAILPAAAIVRCRITRGGVAIEVGDADRGDADRGGKGEAAAGGGGERDGALAPSDAVGHGRAAAEAIARRLCAEAGRPFSGLRPYRRGSAFLRG